MVRETLNGKNPEEDFHYNRIPRVAKYKNAKIASCDVERSFSEYLNTL